MIQNDSNKYWLELKRIRKLDIAQAEWRWCLQNFCWNLLFSVIDFSSSTSLWAQRLCWPSSEVYSRLWNSVWVGWSFGVWWHVSAQAVSDRLHANGSLSAGSPKPWLLCAICRWPCATHCSPQNFRVAMSYEHITLQQRSCIFRDLQVSREQVKSCKGVRFVPENPRPELSSLDARTYAWNAQAWTCVSGNVYQSIAKKNHWKM